MSIIISAPPSAGSGSSTVSVTQASHGFSVGNAIYYTGSAWAKAKSDSANTLGTFVVATVSGNDFTAVSEGILTGLSGLTSGQYYFVSDATAGLLTTTEPVTVGHYSNPLLFALSTTSGLVFAWRPSYISTASHYLANIAITSSLSIVKGTHAGAILTVSGSNTIVATLDTAVGFSTLGLASYYLFNVDSSFSGSFSIATTSSQTINGSASPQVFYPGEVFKLYSDGANWVCH